MAEGAAHAQSTRPGAWATSPPSPSRRSSTAWCVSTEPARSSGRRCCGTTCGRRPPRPELIDELGGPVDGARAWADAVGSVPTASFTVTKLRWLAEHEPDNAARTASVCLPHDWLTWQLGGALTGRAPGEGGLATDRGDASGTGYFSPATGAYRLDLLGRAFGRLAGGSGGARPCAARRQDAGRRDAGLRDRGQRRRGARCRRLPRGRHRVDRDLGNGLRRL